MKGKITISLPSDPSSEYEYVEIALRDEESKTQFCTVKLKLDDFSKALMGIARTPCDLEVQGLDTVGKVKVKQSMQYQVSTETYSELSKAEALKLITEDYEHNHKSDGWLLNDYLGSQTSIVREGGYYKINYSIYRYE